MKQYRRLTYDDRMRIEVLLKQGVNPYKISQILGFRSSSIYREIKLGIVDGKYDAARSHERYLETRNSQGRKSILNINPDLAMRISYLIRVQELSPRLVIEELKKEQYPNCPASYTTIYSAIDAGLIPCVTRETLRSKKTHMFSNGLIKIPQWICEELNLKDNEELTIDTSHGRIIIQKCEDHY